MSDADRRSDRKEVDNRSSAVATRQLGLITRAQAVSAGLSPRSVDRRLAAGRFRVIHRGVYRVAGSPSSWEQRLLAACLWADGVASHRAAARLWKLDGVGEEVVEVITARRLAAPGVLVHTGRVARADLTSVGSIPGTRVPRTLLDLAAVVGPATVESALTDALRRGLTTVGRLERCLERAGGRGRGGTQVLRALMGPVRAGRPESVLELRLIRALRRSGLPQPVAQFGIRRAGRVIARVDLAYPEIRLAIEADGYRSHGGPGAWKRDLNRRNALTALGWHVIHVTWDELSTRPEAVLREIRDAIRRFGSRSV